MDAGCCLVEPCRVEQTKDFPRDPLFRDEHREGVEKVVWHRCSGRGGHPVWIPGSSIHVDRVHFIPCKYHMHIALHPHQASLDVFRKLLLIRSCCPDRTLAQVSWKKCAWTSYFWTRLGSTSTVPLVPTSWRMQFLTLSTCWRKVIIRWPHNNKK